jgi:hypothetical protein
MGLEGLGGLSMSKTQAGAVMETASRALQDIVSRVAADVIEPLDEHFDVLAGLPELERPLNASLGLFDALGSGTVAMTTGGEG